MTQSMFPRDRRRMKQPTKDRLRDQLAIAASRIEQLTAENESLRRPWWRRLINSMKGPKQ